MVKIILSFKPIVFFLELVHNESQNLLCSSIYSQSQQVKPGLQRPLWASFLNILVLSDIWDIICCVTWPPPASLWPSYNWTGPAAPAAWLTHITTALLKVEQELIRMVNINNTVKFYKSNHWRSRFRDLGKDSKNMEDPQWKIPLIFFGNLPLLGFQKRINFS